MQPEWEALRDPDAAEPQFALGQWIDTAPFEQYCDMEILEAQGGRSRLRMPFKVKHAQGGGLMHGGAIAALADTAVAMAIKSRVPEGTPFVTVDLQMTYHAPVRRGAVEARGEVESIEGRDILAVAGVFDERGTQVASFRSHFKILRQSRESGAAQSGD